MNGEQMQPLLEVWLHDRDEAPRDANDGLARVMARLPEVRQRHRWWPLPAFGRPVSTFPGREPAPAPISVTNGRTLARGFTMSSALRFVVAGVIVALFGGYLLAGLLTTQQGDETAPAAVTESRSPMAPEPLLSGMVTEEVEPGVFRVISDGVRSLTSIEGRDIVAGYDGGVWLLRGDGFLRLGSDGSHAWPTGSGDEDCDLEVAPDGTMWAMGCGDPVRSTDGEEWTVQPCPDASTDCQERRELTVAPDGTVWAFDEARHSVSHLEPTGWQALEPDPIAMVRPLLPPTDAGDLYGIGDGWLPVLWRHEDGVWQEQGSVFNVDVGPDGTVWADVGAGWGDPVLPDGQVGFARSAGGEWEVWATADILPDIRIGSTYFGYEREVAPDGSLWFSLWRGPDDSGPFELEWWCDGLVRLDGETFDRFLPGRCPLMDIAADGSVWVLATDEGALAPGEGGFPDDQTWDLYVITPEAVAAREAEATKVSSAEEASDMEEASTTTRDLLSGMITEEVEAGVFRVINDGVRDYSYAEGGWGVPVMG